MCLNDVAITIGEHSALKGIPNGAITGAGVGDLDLTNFVGGNIDALDVHIIG